MKVKRFVNLYQPDALTERQWWGYGYATRKEADAAAFPSDSRAACVEVEIEEPAK